MIKNVKNYIVSTYHKNGRLLLGTTVLCCVLLGYEYYYESASNPSDMHQLNAGTEQLEQASHNPTNTKTYTQVETAGKTAKQDTIHLVFDVRSIERGMALGNPFQQQQAKEVNRLSLDLNVPETPKIHNQLPSSSYQTQRISHLPTISIKQPVTIALQGIIIGVSKQAILVVNQKEVILGEGESFQGVRVTSIEGDTVTYEEGGKSWTLKLR